MFVSEDLTDLLRQMVNDISTHHFKNYVLACNM